MTKKQKEEISQKREKLALNILNKQLNEFNEDEIYNIQTILLDLVTKEKVRKAYKTEHLVERFRDLPDEVFDIIDVDKIKSDWYNDEFWLKEEFKNEV